VTDQQRVLLTVALFVVGAILTVAVSVYLGMVLMVAGLGVLLWGRSLGDRGGRGR
jgi:hypothetical protein